MTKLFVGGLPFAVTSDQLRDMFTKYGEVSSASVVMDKFTGRSRGFGFVEMSDDAAAQQAINERNGSSLEGRTIGVSVAKPREDQPRDGGYNRDNRGGFNRNSGGRDGYRSNRR